MVELRTVLWLYGVKFVAPVPCAISGEELKQCRRKKEIKACRIAGGQVANPAEWVVMCAFFEDGT